MNMGYMDRAKNWFERAVKESDEFVKFILFFIVLEVLVKIEGRSVRSLKQEKAFFDSIPKKDLESLVEELNRKPLQNMNPDGDQRWDGIIKTPEDIDSIVEFIIRARNNLFHGDKGPDEGRDPFVVKYGNKLLGPILNQILNNYGYTN